MSKTYIIHRRFLVRDEGWKHTTHEVSGAYIHAAQEASEAAKHLDQIYGDDHFWTVDLENPEGESYFQLFHGRLS